MKKYLLLTLLTFFCAVNICAQQKGGKHSELKKKELLEFKMKYLADEMGLNDEQRKQFNEVYMQLENERREVFKKNKDIEKSLSSIKNPSEADYDKANKEIRQNKLKLVDIDQKYEEKLSKILSKKQIFILKSAEESFNKKMRVCRDKKKGKNNAGKTACVETNDTLVSHNQNCCM